MWETRICTLGTCYQAASCWQYCPEKWKSPSAEGEITEQVPPCLQANQGILNLERNCTASGTWDTAWFLLSFFGKSDWGIQGNQVYWDLPLYLGSVFGVVGLVSLFFSSWSDPRWSQHCSAEVSQLFLLQDAFRMFQPMSREDFLLNSVGQRSGDGVQPTEDRFLAQQREHLCFLLLWTVWSGLPWRAESSCYRYLFKKDISITQKT